MLSDEDEVWLQDEAEWQNLSTSEWIEYNKISKATTRLPSGTVVTAILERGILLDTCNRMVPQRAIDAGSAWGKCRCAMPKGHDCPHVAVYATGSNAFRVSSMSVRRPNAVAV